MGAVTVPFGTTRRRPFEAGPVLIALLGLTLIVVEFAAISTGPYADAPNVLGAILLFPFGALLSLAAGLIAWRRRPLNQMGPILVFAALAFLLGGLVNTDGHVPVALGTVFSLLTLAVLTHAIHAFPSGRLIGRASQATVGFGYVVMLVLHIPQYLFLPGASSPETVLRIDDNEQIWDIANDVARWSAITVVALTLLILIRRVFVAPRATRAKLALLYVLGSLALAFTVFAASLREPLSLDPLDLFKVQIGLLASVPVVFVLALLRGGFSRAGGLHELAANTELLQASPGNLSRALISALGDPSASLHLADDGPLRAGSPGRGRGSVDIVVGGGVVGTITYDAAIYPTPDTVATVASLFGLIIERDRLASDLRLHEEQLLQSRDRMVQAGDAERRRVASDLHDRLQSRLVLLSMRVQAETAIPSGDGGGGTAVATGGGGPTLRDDLEEAMSELRRVIDNVMPPLLMERGLVAALEELADRMPVPTDLAAATGDARLPASTESTLYFVAAESLTNALKHAEPSELAVRLDRQGDRVTLDIDDDGPGGATVGSGLGLRSLGDRIAAIGGHLEIQTSPAGGTRVHAEVPCAS